jgi:hypothetical protein
LAFALVIALPAMMDSPPPRREMRTLGARDMIRDRKESLFPLEYPKLVRSGGASHARR